MPKVLVLVAGDGAASLAAAAADGARTRRFTEVDVRRVTPSSAPDLTPDDLAAYDGLVLGADPGGAAPLAELLAGVLVPGAPSPLGDRAGAAFVVGALAAAPPAAMALVAALAAAGLLLVPPIAGDPRSRLAVLASPDADAAARRDLHALGRRVADVASWLRHARSHEH